MQFYFLYLILKAKEHEQFYEYSYYRRTGRRNGKAACGSCQSKLQKYRYNGNRNEQHSHICDAEGGADYVATGENAVIVASRTADIIVGPVGIVVADSLLGEISPAMAVAVGQSGAKKILIPVNLCNNIIVGVSDLSMAKLLDCVVDQIKKISDQVFI